METNFKLKGFKPYYLFYGLGRLIDVSNFGLVIGSALQLNGMLESLRTRPASRIVYGSPSEFQTFDFDKIRDDRIPSPAVWLSAISAADKMRSGNFRGNPLAEQPWETFSVPVSLTVEDRSELIEMQIASRAASVEQLTLISLVRLLFVFGVKAESGEVAIIPEPWETGSFESIGVPDLPLIVH